MKRIFYLTVLFSSVLITFLIIPHLIYSKNKPKYIGSDDCEGCHDEYYKSMKEENFHSFVFDNEDSREIYGCEACHGPGEKHVEGQYEDEEKLKEMIINPSKAEAKTSSVQCMKCHQDSFDKDNWFNSAHLHNNIGCNKCHNIHKDKTPKKHDYKLCLNCHKKTLKKINNYKAKFGHKIPKRANCLDCHSPHSVITIETTHDACVKCHKEKKGPFKFEHGNDRIPDCVICHYHHTSSQPKMLKMNELMYADYYNKLEKLKEQLRQRQKSKNKKKRKYRRKRTKKRSRRKSKGDNYEKYILFCAQCHGPHSFNSCLKCHMQPLHVNATRGGMCLGCHTGHGGGGGCGCHGNPHPNGVTPPNCQRCHGGHYEKSCIKCHPAIHGSEKSRRMLDIDNKNIKIRIPPDDTVPKPKKSGSGRENRKRQRPRRDSGLPPGHPSLK